MSKQTKASKAIVIGMLALGLAGVGALAIYVQGHAKAVTDQRADVEPVMTKPIEAPKETTTKVATERTVVLTPVMKGMDLTFTQETKDVPQGEEPHVFAVNEYLHKIPAVPRDARLLAFELENRMAILSFNDKFVNAGFGSEDEKAVLDGIAATMGLDSAIDSVQIESDGRKVDTLGHADLSDPMPAIRPDGTVVKLSEKPQP